MKLFLRSIQWGIFILAGSFVTPIAIAAVFHLSQQETGELLQRTFFVIGIACLLQVFFGHKLQVKEGPAGLWWGVFLSFSSLGTTMNLSLSQILQSIQMGLIIGGLLLILLVGFNLINKIKIVFTPIVIGTYLLLLMTQLSGSFIKGMMGIGNSNPYVDGKIMFLSMMILFVTISLTRSPYPKLRSYAILLGCIFGWILFALFGLSEVLNIQTSSFISFPKPLAWGIPTFEISIVITSILASLLMITNLIASTKLTQKMVDPDNPLSYNKSTFIMGLNQILCGIFSTVGLIPMSVSAGFIEKTGIKEKAPYIIGSSFMILISFFPKLTYFFASLPVPVGYAAVLAVFANLGEVALKEYVSVGMTEDNLFTIGISLFIGLGSMFIPAEALKYLPNFLVPIMNNGMILGVITCIFLQQIIKKKQVVRTQEEVSSI